VSGYVSEGFEPVRHEFEKNFTKGLEENAQLCVYYKGQIVVDLYGVVDDTNGYDADSTTTVFSSSKVLTSVAIATLVDKQLLSYSDRVVQHWPEYGTGDKDKEQMTIAQILQHEGGMPVFSKTQTLADIQTENIKKNSLGRIIENEKLQFPPSKAETTREYHAFTRGTILNEIYRRVDPNHRTVGECVREEIALPLYANVAIGLQYEQLEKSFDFEMSSIGKIALEGMLPHNLRKTVPNVVDLAKLGAFVLPYVKAAPMLEHMTNKYDIEDMLDKFSYSVVKTGEIPSANGQCSARGIARVAAMLANRGEIDGIRILSEEAWDELHGNEVEKEMHPTGDWTSFTQGGVNVFKHIDGHHMALTKHNNDCRLGFIGWMGLGGSVFQYHPKYKIGFGYVPTFLAYEDIGNEKGAMLQRRVLECVQKKMKERKVYYIDNEGVARDSIAANVLRAVLSIPT